MIYVGYSCIGKTSISGRDGFIDLESSIFNDHSENWTEKYILTAENLSDQGYDVFVSSHKAVRDKLKEHNIKYICVFPAFNLEDAWFERLANRYKKIPSEKNLRALSGWPYFREDITDLQKEDYIIVLHEANYDLALAVKNTEIQDNYAIYSACDPIKTPIQSRSGKVVNDIWDETDILDTNE